MRFLQNLNKLFEKMNTYFWKYKKKFMYISRYMAHILSNYDTNMDESDN